MLHRRCLFFCFLVLLLASCNLFSPPSTTLVNWETPHVNPLALTPDGKTLLAVNTADNRLEIFDVTGPAPVLIGEVPVGLDPVSVCARSDSEAWVVNHVSDSVSIVDLPSQRVTATLAVGDEPCDVVFAGDPERAFVSLSQENRLKVYDPANLAAEPVVIEIEGEDPRALAVDSKNQRVYLAIFESGNGTTIIRHEDVSAPDGPYGGNNPPPNKGFIFDPAIEVAAPGPPRAAHIVRKQPDGKWRDGNGADWSSKVTWDLHDHDVAVIDANTLGVSYVSGLMNLDMNLAVRPSGEVTVIGSEALNEMRFEPNVKSIFTRMHMATFDPAAPKNPRIADLNPQLDYTSRSIPPTFREDSISDPRDIVWTPAGDRAFVAGMGSDNVIVIDPDGNRLARINVPAGPTGLALDGSRGRLYVLSKFDAAITTISTDTHFVLSTTPFFDPTPAEIKIGRPHLYNATKSSGLGQVSCGTCHVDARMDQIAWDLGNPAGEMKTFNQSCNGIFEFMCEDWHPMKGPLTTQSLVGMIGTEPFHWRGDRENLAAFNGAFESLLSADQGLTDQEMSEFEDFLATIKSPPNPFRQMENTLRDSMMVRGISTNPTRGFGLYQNRNSDGGVFTCQTCHSLPTGFNASVIANDTLITPQDFKVAQLRNIYEKTGFDRNSMHNNRGFALSHDGAFENVDLFLTHEVFSLPEEQDRLDLESFVWSFATDTHAAVGAQTTLRGLPDGDVSAKQLVRRMQAIADKGEVGLVVKGRQGGVSRGYAYLNGMGLLQADRGREFVPFELLLQSANPGNELTYTLVPIGTQTRIGIDRDNDGTFDGDDKDPAPVNAKFIKMDVFKPIPLAPHYTTGLPH